ncbi:hypothetical protein FCL47_04085 [Desulfopila sp. IMCC35006]|uniref:hypothetical protein n=1 Tax=Desulfopila sp. IMCC35006 TaxID=2569542 RepID=UPI0010ABD1A5|nr:hypothetical protein [Desulfopila sp. IMCC35006]TKB27329.1 hypothetical protein FCL47_04085 [Desulfopila sp. IMCC35006]
MIHENWLLLLLYSFLLVALGNSLLASCTAIYYQNQSIGRLSHSQLRIKQGTATLEQRINVFAQSLIFSFISFRIYFITLLVWLAACGAYYFFPIH